MSHNIRYFEYKAEKFNKKKVEKDLNTFVRQATREEGGSGLGSPIRWLNDIADNYEDAQDHIDKVDRGWYDQIAMRYRVSIKPTTQAYKKLLAQWKEINDKLLEMQNTVHYKSVKSAFVGCKECGSKLATKYIRTNRCPLCGKDLRPATTLNTIERLKAKQKELDKKITEAERKASAKAPLMWLIKIEYHT